MNKMTNEQTVYVSRKYEQPIYSQDGEERYCGSEPRTEVVGCYTGTLPLVMSYLDLSARYSKEENRGRVEYRVENTKDEKATLITPDMLRSLKDKLKPAVERKVNQLSKEIKSLEARIAEMQGDLA